jgi:hypothetical protein
LLLTLAAPARAESQNDDFDMYSENPDDGFEETTLDSHTPFEETIPEDPEPALSATPQQYSQSTPDTQTSEKFDESGLIKEDQEELNVSMTKSEELGLVVCLSAYSKRATTEQEMFQRKLAKLFADSKIYEEKKKLGLVEKYVVSAVQGNLYL